MRNKLIYILGLGLFLAVCYLFADLALKRFLSEERLRVMLIEPVQDQLGRQVKIGNIKVSVFSGIEIKDIAIQEKDPIQEFASIGSFRIKYEFLPLFEKRLVITELLFDHPTIRVVKDPQGAFNFADLTLKPKDVVKEIPPPELQTAAPLPVTLVFNQIKVDSLNLTFTDQTGKLPAIISTDGDLTFTLSLGKTMAEARYQGVLELLVNAAYRSHRPVLLLKGNFNNQQINFTGELNAELDKLMFDGQLANLQTSPDLTLNLQGGKFDLDNLIAADPANGKKPTKTPVVASTPTEANPTSTKLSAHGKISIKELQRQKMSMQNLELSYSFAGNVIEIGNLTAGLFGGSLSGLASIDLRHSAPAFRGQFKADKLQMAAAMAAFDKPKGYLTGDFSGDFSGRGSGADWPEIRENLDGQMKFAIIKGGLESSPISQALASLLGIPELDNLKFDRLSGSLTIAGGQAALDSSLSGRALSLQTKGSIGLNGSLDLPLSLKLSPENSRRLQERASFTRYLSDPYGRTTLNLKLMGTVDHPDLSLSGEGAGNQIKNALGKKAGEEVGRAITKNLGGLDNRNQAAVGGAADQILNKLFGN